MLSTTPFEQWQSALQAAMEAFLLDTQRQVMALQLEPKSLLISYLPGTSAGLDMEAAALALEQPFKALGLQVTCAVLRDTQTLEAQLANHRFAIVLCTPAYAQQVANHPGIRLALDAFGQQHKNALQPLLCEGGFGDTALQIVDKHYFIRSYKEVLQGTLLRPLEAFIDIFYKLSGSQGLGLLPDILGLKDKEQRVAESLYQTLLETFNLRVAQSTIRYRLSMALQESLSTHRFQAYLPAVLPVIEAGQAPGFGPVLDGFLGSEHKAKISLLLCEHGADVELSHLALLKELQTRGARVLALDCAAYAGKSSKGSVRARLQALKLQPDAALLSEPLVLLLKGYQDLGAYDNLYVQNQLGTWPELKVLVTCTAAFFESRSPLNCFLKLGSERRIEDLVVYTVPGFAPMEAKKLS
ncbi:MAG: hypothetical protein KA508_06385, partial [Gammaproteobacteria bacterium]|nr:hypothetical protein [Gammaproteobacteria bacterium]